MGWLEVRREFELIDSFSTGNVNKIERIVRLGHAEQSRLAIKLPKYERVRPSDSEIDIESPPCVASGRTGHMSFSFRGPCVPDR
jgi:hypothetical protein